MAESCWIAGGGGRAPAPEAPGGEAAEARTGAAPPPATAFAAAAAATARSGPQRQGGCKRKMWEGTFGGGAQAGENKRKMKVVVGQSLGHSSIATESEKKVSTAVAPSTPVTQPVFR